MGLPRPWVFVCLTDLMATATLAVNLQTVLVGNPGNAADTRYASPGFGSVGYVYHMGKYEVTAAQYCEFLNAVAVTDTYGLYNPRMDYTAYPLSSGCNIKRTGTAGQYAYSVGPAWADRPVNYVDWGDAARFANWMHNGQPIGLQDLTTTEDGSYHLNGATSSGTLLSVARKPDATWVVPSEDEWYKSAYTRYYPTLYCDYPTRYNSAPGRDMNDTNGNNANYYNGNVVSFRPIDSGLYPTTLAGEFQRSASYYGTFDQGGNVWEWNEATVDGVDRVLRGGAFHISSDFMHASYRGHTSPTGESGAIGFRLALVPDPATLVMMFFGCCAVFSRRWPAAGS